MEKYSRWSDLTTGINPFVPHKQRLHDSLGVRALQLLARAPLLIVRLPLLLVGGVLLVVTNIIVSVLVSKPCIYPPLCSVLSKLTNDIGQGFVPLLGRFLKRLVEWLLCSLLLLIMGVFVSEEPANTRRLGLTTPGAKASSKSMSVAAKDVVVCNHTSFLEILYLARRFSPVFCFVTEEGASKGLVHACGLIEAIYRGFAMPSLEQRGTPRKLEDVILHAAGPVVVFPEGARTNGKTVLRFLPILEQLPFQLSTKNGGKKLELKIHIIAFRYEFTSFGPNHSAGSGWKHLMWTCLYAYHTARVTHLHAKDLNLHDVGPATRSKPSSATSATQLTTVHVERLRGLLASMLRTKPVDMTVKDFLSFNAYWSHVTGGGKKSAAEFTDRKAPHEHAQWTTRK
jgi:1-acylglycerol-3-phosphate O-acyltransferase